MNDNSPASWNAEAILSLGRNYQGAAVLVAAAELDLFTPLAASPRSAAELAAVVGADLRGLTVLMDALVALRVLSKSGDRYAPAPGINELATPTGSQTVLAMLQHQANCLRRWAQVAQVVKTGRPAQHIPSVRGESGDQESFIGAMHNVSAPMADGVIQAIQPLKFEHLLDIGGASGTWTMAFLRACLTGRATLFDLPPVITLARKRLSESGFAERVTLVPGDFLTDPLPGGTDLAWVSAIVHQNSREQNRALFAKVFGALVPGGRIAIRDVVMDVTRTRPAAGALFAVNMLVATESGGTFTFDELREDLESAGFAHADLTRDDEGMNSIVVASKPASR
ncbi:MAG TPA: methyltransferase [Verrucomicrobiae bacterium]